MLAAILPSKTDHAGEIIKKTTGYYLYMYYQYVAEYKLRPVTLTDLIDGLLYIRATKEIKELYSE